MIGVETSEKMEIAERVELFINNFLTNTDKSYYPDSEQLIIYTIFCGSAFRKVYPNQKDGSPLARMVKPQDFIVNPDTVDLMSSTRMTQVVHYTRKEVIQMEQSGFYKKGTLPLLNSDSEDEDISEFTRTIERTEGVNSSGTENKMSIRYYECHVEMDPALVEKGVFKPSDEEGESYKPYIVTLCANTRKIASIRRGWVEGSPTFEREIYFVDYYYVRGFGIYGLGLAHLMGSNSIVLTSVLRQLVDSGTLKNFPAFLIAKGSRLENNDKALGPGEGREVETAGLPIQQIIMPLPYSEPSSVLIQLKNEIMEQTSAIAAASQSEIPDIGANAPVGTTLALLEVQNRVQSTVLRSFRVSLGNELKLIYKLFSQYLPDEPYPFNVPGKESAVMRSDFNDSINIIPASDPNMMMKTHRLMVADAVSATAASAPELHNMREVIKRKYEAMGVADIDSILPPPAQPTSLDAITENAYFMAGKPVIANVDQDHETHLLIHKTIEQSLQQLNLPAYVQLIEHEQVHKAFKVVISTPEIQQRIMPYTQEWMKNPSLLLLDPEIQRQVDQMDGQEELQKQEQLNQQAMTTPQPLEPTHIMAEEVNQKREASQMKLEETKIKSDTELAVAEMRLQGERERMELQRQLAEEKQKFDMLMEKIKSYGKEINLNEVMK